MSRRSVLSMRVSGSLDPVLPLRGYLLAVAGALLLLLLAADWVLPAPLPGRFDESNPALPPIRIHSDVKGPEAVSIDTNQPLPAHTDEVVMVASQPGSLDAPDAAQQAGAPCPARLGRASFCGSVDCASARQPGAVHSRPGCRNRSQEAHAEGWAEVLSRSSRKAVTACPTLEANEASGRCGDAFAFFRP
ncbi:hypothetical protein [Bradyrhizobium sp. STM 3557]|uniref:hypothetical protein n=1 Tax=Bradyrhizobium sp. STM 3557 TaxID=578920 RepID=UPI00388DC3D7